MSASESPSEPAVFLPIFRALTIASCLAASVVLSACSSSGGGTADTSIEDSGVQLLSIHQGKLVDVYGLRTIGGNQVIELFQTDMVIGVDIADERTAESSKRDAEILFDFVSANADTLQPRLLITREIGSADFEKALDRLDDQLRLVSPTVFGKDVSKSPYSVVPRNAGFQLTFSGKLGITDDFFYERDSSNRVVGVKNTEAVQLLKIVGDPNDAEDNGDFQVLSSRIAVRDNKIIIDPVLLGSEGLTFGVRNTAAGLPESPDQAGANIRIAIALDGPLSIDNVSADKIGTISGRNNDGLNSIVRDFRSGNVLDEGPDINRGFIRDPLPPRVVGQMLMYLEGVEEVNPQTKLLRIFKDGIYHELDRGDLLRVFSDSTGIPLASLEILQDPEDDLGKPEVQRVRVLVRPIVGPDGEDVLENIDPSNLAGFPVFAGKDRDLFVRKFAPKTVLVAEYTHRRLRPTTGDYYGDDARNFLSFSPTPLPNAEGVTVGNEFVSPEAGAIVRFSKPIDLSTLIAADTAFFATRNVLDQTAIAKFIKDMGIEESKFNGEKFKTPHLISSRIFDQDGSATSVLIRPTRGFYLDKTMRDAAEADKDLPFTSRRYHYFLHLVSGLGGITDLSGNPLDFQARRDPKLPVVDQLVMEFSVDTRNLTNSKTKEPRFQDNIVVNIVRRFADRDEDERPNLYLPGEITPKNSGTPAAATTSPDFFGPIAYLESGQMIPRGATRTRKVVDSLNQLPAPAMTSPLRWCPQSVSNQNQVIFQSAATVFGQPIQNPMNPQGCRLQTVWREIDMSLSRTDPNDFNLDVEQLYWAPFARGTIVFDEFDRISLFLGHSEFRPEPCVSSGAAFPSMQQSGLKPKFQQNYARNLTTLGNPDVVERQPARHPAYIDQVMRISAKDAILESNGVNRFLPLPKFQDATKGSSVKNPYFVWRDEQEIVQGGDNAIDPARMAPYPYILSPFLGGKGAAVFGNPPAYSPGGWLNGRNKGLRAGGFETKTDGTVGAIALPLLADFWTYPDSPQLPVDNPFRATGANGWQISLAVTSSPRPDFRAYSAGRGGPSPQPIDPAHRNWKVASGGYTPTGGFNPNRSDNSVYWIMADFLKRTAVVTSGFVEITDPHRMKGVTNADPRLGPYVAQTGALPEFDYDFEPPLATLPAGTNVVTEFRGASRIEVVGGANAWPPSSAIGSNGLNLANFPLDPLKAGDAHIRHFDDRPLASGAPRNWWTYLYNRTVTGYVTDPNTLMEAKYTNQFSGPNEAFNPRDLRYFNWRFIMENNVEADPPVSPRIESFTISYRFSK